MKALTAQQVIDVSGGNPVLAAVVAYVCGKMVDDMISRIGEGGGSLDFSSAVQGA